MNTEFTPGSTVCYGHLGKCTVLGIEEKSVSNQTIRFYKLEVQKPAFVKSKKPEPYIWIPVSTAQDRGLRSPLENEKAQEVLSILSNREYYFQLNEKWHEIVPKLETVIRTEGAYGLAKVFSYLYVLTHKQVVAQPEAQRLLESVKRALLKELSDILGETMGSLEIKLQKGLKQKLLHDH